MQSLSLFGVYGLSLITVFCATSFFSFRIKNNNIIFPLIATLVLLTTFLFGYNRVSNYEVIKSGVSLRIVHTDFNQNEKWKKETHKKIAEMGSQDLITIFPETAFGMDGIGPSNWFIGHIRNEAGLYYNSLSFNGHQYDKIKLVPFGEKIPFSNFLKIFFPKNSLLLNSMKSGNDNQSFEKKITPLICYEAVFPNFVRNKINSETEGGLGLTIPSYRTDVQREADIIEEILRVYGYNNIEFSHKLNTSISFDSNKETKIENVVAEQLSALGFNETMANSLTKASYASLSDNINEEANVAMLNPLSNDLGVLRQSLLFSGLESVAYNLNRKNNALKFYEFGKTYHNYNSSYQEDKHLTLFITGNRTKDSWKTSATVSDFFYAKGIILSILERVGIHNVKSSPTKNDIFSEGITLSLGKIKLLLLTFV